MNHTSQNWINEYKIKTRKIHGRRDDDVTNHLLLYLMSKFITKQKQKYTVEHEMWVYKFFEFDKYFVVVVLYMRSLYTRVINLIPKMVHLRSFLMYTNQIQFKFIYVVERIFATDWNRILQAKMTY